MLFIAGFGVAWALEETVPLRAPLGATFRVVRLAMGGLAVAGGAILYLSAIRALRRARTGVLPGQNTARLVVYGPYRFSRNPAYVGLGVVWCGVAAVLNWLWPFLLLPVVLVSQHLLVVREEERHLAEVFGDEYASYCRRVRRWI
jgi:protein-S-isoprenylcysteine O-methyltransferase Ste14